jgi:hypothetical protein
MQKEGNISKGTDLKAKCISVQRRYQGILKPHLQSQGNQTPMFPLAEMANGWLSVAPTSHLTAHV